MPGRILRALMMLSVPFVLVVALADAQAPKQTAPAKATVIPVAKKQGTTDANSYSIAAERQTLREIHKRAQTRVRDLSESLPSVADESARRALQQRISDIKREARLEHLRAKAYYALGRGDLQAAHDIHQIIERVLEPRFSVPVTPADEPVLLPEKGGRP